MITLTGHTKLRRTPLEGWLSRLRDITDNKQHPQEKNTRASTGFEPEIPARERPQTHAYDHANTGIGCKFALLAQFAAQVEDLEVCLAVHPCYTPSKEQQVAALLRMFKQIAVAKLEILLSLFLALREIVKQLRIFHQPTLMYNFLYSLTIYLLHYYPRHVSSINMPIFRRKNCFHTASGISPLSTSALCRRLQRAKIPDAVWIQFFLLKMGMLMFETSRG